LLSQTGFDFEFSRFPPEDGDVGAALARVGLQGEADEGGARQRRRRKRGASGTIGPSKQHGLGRKHENQRAEVSHCQNSCNLSQGF